MEIGQIIDLIHNGYELKTYKSRDSEIFQNKCILILVLDGILEFWSYNGETIHDRIEKGVWLRIDNNEKLELVSLTASKVLLIIE